MTSKGISKTKKNTSNTNPFEDLDDDEFQYYDKHTGGTFCDKILLNNKLRVGIVLFLFAVVIPLAVYYFVSPGKINQGPDLSDVWGTCVLRPEYSVPCLIGREVLREDCGSIGCCWNVTTSECYHSLPSKFQYLTDSATNDNLSLVLQPQTAVTPFRTPMVATLSCLIEPQSESHLRIRIQTVSENAPNWNSSVDIKDTLFNVTVAATPTEKFYVEVHRRLVEGDRRNASMLLSTARGPQIASENFWEITFQLPKDGVTYGLGRLRLKSGDENPKVLHSNWNNTGSHPILISIDSEGQASGVYIQNEGPMEILFNHEVNFVILRSLSNEGFTVHLFAGPAPRDVMVQMTEMIGRPKMPPYWALGLHVCKDSVVGEMKNVTQIVKELEQFVEAADAMGLPFDSHCLHEKLMHEFTYDIASDEDVVKIAEVLEALRNTSRKFLVSLPPHLVKGNNLAYTSALELDILIQASSDNDSTYIGEVSGVPVVYPDWREPASEIWMQERMAALQERLGGVDGVVLQDNWPADNQTHALNETFIYLPERLNGSMSNGTLWWDAVHKDGSLHNDVHNTYSLHHVERTAASLNASSLLLTSSSHIGAGRHAGTHAPSTTYVPARWAQLREALVTALGLGLAGMPLAGGPICGSSQDFNHTTHEALCLKWYLMGITLPMMRVASVEPYRDPTSFPAGFTRVAVTRAIRLRYALLPYFYTLFREAADVGTPVARPMFHEFPQDNVTRFMDEQFMLGAAILVAPVVEPQAVAVQIYLPAERIRWYHFVGGYPVNNGTGGHLLTVSILETEILMLLRSGHIVPLQNVSSSATTSRRTPHHLVVGLHCTDSCSATGHLYLDSEDQTVGANLTLSANASSISVSNLNATRSFICGDQQHVSTQIGAISVYGLEDDADFTMKINGREVKAAMTEYVKKDLVLRISNLGDDWCTNDDDEMVFSW